MRRLTPCPLLASPLAALWRCLLPQSETQRKKARTARKTPLRVRHPLLWRARLGFLLAAAAAAPGWILLSHQATELGHALRLGAIKLSAEAGFIIRDVLVKGHSETTHAALLAALGVNYGQPLIAFDPETARTALLSAAVALDDHMHIESN